MPIPCSSYAIGSNPISCGSGAPSVMLCERAHAPTSEFGLPYEICRRNPTAYRNEMASIAFGQCDCLGRADGVRPDLHELPTGLGDFVKSPKGLCRMRRRCQTTSPRMVNSLPQPFGG